MEKLTYEFYHRPCPVVARELVGKVLVRRVDGQELRLRITETECYCGESDTACHASKGRTKRTETMYAPAGTLYVYLCYGVHWMLNIVTGEENEPEAVLIRACEGKFNGPGRLPSAPTQRWQGITMAMGFAPTACPTAWADILGLHKISAALLASSP